MLMKKEKFLPPDHIANLMYSLALCTKENTILDPTCGSGTFLTNAMANMFNEINADEDFHEMQKSIKEARLIGIECNEFNVTLAGINMILHRDGSSCIYYGDCFNLLKSFRNIYDRVLMNPQSCVKGTEQDNILYLEKIFEIADLKAVISLPSNLFYPVGANTCIVVLQKNKIGNETILINCLDDGYSIVNKARIDSEQKWETIRQDILNAYLYDNFTEFRVIKKSNLKPDDELLFEAYSSHRPLDIEKSIFARYLRENISAKILCNFTLIKKELESEAIKPFKFSRFQISDLLEK